jgi:hypothetical protein
MAICDSHLQFSKRDSPALCLVLAMASIAIAPAARAADSVWQDSEQSVRATPFEDPLAAANTSYTFFLSDSRDPGLCTHMEAVFNSKFKEMWKDPPAMQSIPLTFSSTSQYAFPLVSGVSHDIKATFAMRFSKVPSSSEFDAISWAEGRTELAPVSLDNGIRRPYLISYVDFDNDAIMDTIVKVSFSIGYPWLFFHGGDTGDAELLLVFRGQHVDPSTISNIPDLIRGSALRSKPLVVNGDWLRPFIYRNKTYVASYSQGFDDKPTKQSRANRRMHLPPHETIVIYAYRLLARDNSDPVLNGRTICRLDMTQETRQ